MAVPEEIRLVKRPKNTVVEDRGGNGPNRYAVRERGKIKCIPGKNPQPHNGRVIGHIVNLKFIPKDGRNTEFKENKKPDCLSHGSSALIQSLSNDILDDLLDIFEPKRAFTILAIAALKVIKPGILDSKISEEYNRTFISQYYPGATVSKNSLSKLYKELGMYGEYRRKFFQKRLASVMKEHHIVIDGTLKDNNSSVNDFSAFSHKAKVKGTKDISVIYAYDIEKMEPLCGEVFPGNTIDGSAYSSFIRDNNITKGIIIADKGFPPSQIAEELKNRPNLHILTPIKRNDSRIKNNNNMLSYQGTLKEVEGEILFSKKQIKGGRFLYAYFDQYRGSLEEKTFIKNANKNDSYDDENFKDKRKTFGVIVLESDLDLDPVVAYKCYQERWKIEVMFKHYKSDICLDKVRVQDDFSVIGKEFINVIATIITSRIIKLYQDKGICDDYTYDEMMEKLTSTWRRTDAPNEKPVTKDEYWVHPYITFYDVMEKLGVCEPLPKPEPKKRGRRPKNSIQN